MIASTKISNKKVSINVAVIINPFSRKKKQSLISFLKSENYRFLVYKTGKSGAYKPAMDALEKGARILISVGGDGTARQVAQAILDFGNGQKTMLCVFPSGRANDLSLEIGVTNDLKMLRKRLHSKGKLIDVILINGKCALTAGGICLPAFSSSFAGKYRWVPFIDVYDFSAILGILFGNQHSDLVLEAKGKVICSRFISVSFHNQSTIGKKFILAPSALNNDGKFDVCAIKDSGWISNLSILWKITKGNHLKEKNVELFQAKRILVRADKPFQFAADGDVLGVSRKLEIKILPSAIRLC